MSIRVALVGVGNVASALVQGITKRRRTGGALVGTYPQIAGAVKKEIEIVCAFDINPRKVGRDLTEAIFVAPNCARLVVEPGPSNVIVRQGRMFDKPGRAMNQFLEWEESDQDFEIARNLEETNSEVLVILIPSGFNKTAQYYAMQGERAGCGIVNGMSAKVARSSEIWSRGGLPQVAVIGDDVRSQLGATFLHQELAKMFSKRGARLHHTMQLDWGGDADFLNLSIDGMYSSGKQAGKLEAVQRVCEEGSSVIVGGVDYVPFLGNKKEAYIRCEGSIFGEALLRLDMFMAVDDAYNSAGVLVDMIRLLAVARAAEESGVLDFASSLFCKSPRRAYEEERCIAWLEKFLKTSPECR